MTLVVVLTYRGILKNRSCDILNNYDRIRHLLTLRALIEKQIRKSEDTFVTFVDLEKAFDDVKRSKLFDILKTIGIKYYDRRYIYNLYKNRTLLVRTDGKEEEVRIKKGVRQDCNLSSAELFNLYIEKVMEDLSIKVEQGVKTGGETINALRFADGVAFCAETEESLQNVLSNVNKIVWDEYGTRLNKKKIQRL